MTARAARLVLAVFLGACFRHAPLPAATEPRPESALGRCAAGIDEATACGAWADATERCGGDAAEHASFPELVPAQSCFVTVTHAADGVARPGPLPDGCGYAVDGF